MTHETSEISAKYVDRMVASELTAGTKHSLDEDEIDTIAKKQKLDCEATPATDNKGDVFKRKKVALLMAYSGQGYYGMQRNTGFKTIEEDLLSSLLKAGVITQENYDVPQSMHFQRAARTDKSVSAARQVVSLRLNLIDNLVKVLNANLPPQIQVMSIKRATKGFNSKLWCDGRTYSYTLPTFAFAPATEITSEDYRINADIINKVNSILEMFKGTRNFHNFTSGKKPWEPSAQRYIMEFECGEPFLEDGLELVAIKVKGQSFMLHQIRKMIGITIAIIRDLANKEVIEKAWKKDKVDIPIAPGVGLVLEEVHYEKYNRRYGNDGMHESLDWTDFHQIICDFKKRYIHPTLIHAEKQEKSMFQWLATLPMHTYDVREAGPHIPIDRSQTRSPFGNAMVSVGMQKQLLDSGDSLAMSKQCEEVSKDFLSNEGINKLHETDAENADRKFELSSVKLTTNHKDVDSLSNELNVQEVELTK